MSESNEKMKVCKHCGMGIAKSARVCPHCGGKNKKPVHKRVWFWLLIIAFVLLVLAVIGSGNQYKLSDDAKNMSAKEFKAACTQVGYKDMVRNADEYVGKKVKLVGQVVQVCFDAENGESEYRVDVTRDSYGFYSDTVYLYFDRGDGKKIIEDDIITIYGELSGEKTYETVMGAEVTIPAVTGVYVKIH